MELLTRGETKIDKCWINSAQKNRHLVTVYGKRDNTTTIYTIGGQIRGIFNDPGDKARHALMKVCNHLGTGYSDRKRDFWMVNDADSLYFVGNFSMDNERLQIGGDEAWIVEMFFDKLVNQGMVRDFPIYMYSDQMTCWCRLEYDFKLKRPKWIKSLPDRPRGKYIGIGGKKLTENIQTELSLL